MHSEGRDELCGIGLVKLVVGSHIVRPPRLDVKFNGKSRANRTFSPVSFKLSIIHCPLLTLPHDGTHPAAATDQSV